MPSPRSTVPRPSAANLVVISLFSLAIAPAAARAHGTHSAGAAADLRANVEMLRAIAEGAPALAEAPAVAAASHRVGGRSVEFDGAFHRVFRAMIRSYDRALREDCETCATWDPEWFVERAEEFEPEARRSFLRRKLVDPALEVGEHVAFGAGRLGGEFGQVALYAKAIAEVLESWGSLLWAKILGPIHFLCPAIDATIAFGQAGVNTWHHLFTHQGIVGRSGYRGFTDEFKYAYLSAKAHRATRRVQFAMGPFDIDEAQMAALDLGPKKWWGWARTGAQAKFLRSLQVRQDQAQEFKLLRKQFTSPRYKRFLFMVTRRSYLGSKRPLDKLLARPQLWVLAAQERILEKAAVPRAGVVEDSVERVDHAPVDDVRSGLARRYADRAAAGNLAEDAETFDGMLRSIGIVFDPAAPSAVRKFQADFIEIGLRKLVYGRTASLVEEKADLLNDGREDIPVRLGDIGRHFSLGWRTGLTLRFMSSYFDSLKIAAGETSADRLFANKHASMEMFLKLWGALGENIGVVDVEDRDGLLQYKTDVLRRYRELNAFSPWFEKFKSAYWLPFGFTLTPWRHPKASYAWSPIYRKRPFCRDLHLEEP